MKNIGEIHFELTVWDVPEANLASFKAYVDARITEWRAQYPSLHIDRGRIQFNETQ